MDWILVIGIIFLAIGIIVYIIPFFLNCMYEFVAMLIDHLKYRSNSH